MLRSSITIVLSSVLAWGLTACGTDASTPGGTTERPTVAVSFFPIADAARAIAGDAVDMLDLTPPGVSPHDLEVTSQQRGSLETADAVIYLGSGFQPQVERVVDELDDGVTAVNLLDAVELLPVIDQLAGTQRVDGEVLPDDLDPHAWVAPRSFATMVGAMTQP